MTARRAPVRIIFQTVGATTDALGRLNVGTAFEISWDRWENLPNWKALHRVCVVGGGVGCAIALPIAEELHRRGWKVHAIIGFRPRDLLILEDEFRACSGSFGCHDG